MVNEKALFSVGKMLLERFKKVVREKEKNQKDFFLPYYSEVEDVLSKHLPVITWLNREVTTFSHGSEEEMIAQIEIIEEHNKEVFEAADKASEGKSIKDMAQEVENLVIKVKGTVDQSLIVSLEQYIRDLYEADNISEYHFLQDPCQNILDLTRDLKSKIPTVHSDFEGQ
ncbi:hypothetical protein [Vibrio mediterranei]|uniref:hypothetical protein n=1 Tax=Vibrio mediterranei TaxID=689 RepID=UPI001EFE5CD2|nr:hypothetical protein [Vibrio mediterranei]MCG9661214.1 hypothetical protein [Vibrio mediterranei]